MGRRGEEGERDAPLIVYANVCGNGNTVYSVVSWAGVNTSAAIVFALWGHSLSGLCADTGRPTYFLIHHRRITI